MAAIKLTTSGKAIQFIDDKGQVYQTSVYDYNLLITGQKKFTTPVRLPFDVNPERWPASPLLKSNPDGKWEKVDIPRDFKIGGHDAYDLKKLGEEKAKKKFEEVKEW